MKQGIKYYIAIMLVIGGFTAVYYAYIFMIKDNSNSLPPRLVSYTPLPTIDDRNIAWNDSICIGKSLCLISPKRNDTLCIGQPIDIQWNAPPDMQAINIQIQETGPNRSDYGIATVHASSPDLHFPGRGHFTWKVGEIIEGFGGIQAGKNYTFNIYGYYKNDTLQDRNDFRTINIRQCN